VNTSQHTRWWIPIPAWAVAVRWCADAESELDALEHTVLALVRNAPRALDPLAELLGIGDDVVLSALLALADRGLVTPPGPDASLWKATQDVTLPGSELRSGTAYITAHGGFRSVARLAQPSRNQRPPTDTDADVLDSALVEGVNIDRPNPGDVAEALARGVARGTMLCPAMSAVSAADATQFASLVRLDPLDAEGKKSGWRRTEVWAAVDVLPGLGADATLVFHEPDLAPHAEQDTPVSTALEKWVRMHAKKLDAELEHRVRALAIDRSVVLQAAGLASMAQLDEAVGRHRAALATQLGLALPQSWPAPFAEAHDRLCEASRWLLVARKEPRFDDARARCQAAAVEALAQSLWQSVRDDLKAWSALWRPRLEGAGKLSKTERRSRFSADALTQRLKAFGLHDKLGASLEHLKGSTEDLSRTIKTIERGEPGAGESVVLWLLPLPLLELEAAKRHADRVHRALACDPYLFDHLAALIDARNVIVHLRDATLTGLETRPEDLEAMLLRVAVALAPCVD
jgi:hypothetical protein